MRVGDWQENIPLSKANVFQKQWFQKGEIVFFANLLYYLKNIFVEAFALLEKRYEENKWKGLVFTIPFKTFAINSHPS